MITLPTHTFSNHETLSLRHGVFNKSQYLELELKLSGTGSPHTPINNNIKNGKYIPFLPLCAIKRNIAKTDRFLSDNLDFGQGSELNNNLFEEEQCL